jgi:hypothetical protein
LEVKGKTPTKDYTENQAISSLIELESSFSSPKLVYYHNASSVKAIIEKVRVLQPLSAAN